MQASVAEAHSVRLTPLRLLHIRPCDPSLLPELRQHFERSGFSVDRAGDAIDVRQPDAPNEQQATREILLHLRVWLAMRPDSIEEPTSDL